MERRPEQNEDVTAGEEGIRFWMMIKNNKGVKHWAPRMN